MQSVLNEYIVRQEHEVRCSDAEMNEGVKHLSMELSAFLLGCRNCLFMKHGKGHHYYLFLKCWDFLDEKLSSDARSCGSDGGITLTSLTNFLTTHREDFENILHLVIQDVIENVNRNNLQERLVSKVSSLQREIGEVVMQCTVITSRDVISSLCHTIRRVQSFYSNADCAQLDCETGPDFFNQLDCNFAAHAEDFFSDYASRMFHNEHNDFFEIFLNKLNLCNFSPMMENILSKSLACLLTARDAMRKAAADTVDKLEVTGKEAIRQHRFRDLECILQKLKIGHFQLDSLLTEFAEIQRVYWDIIGMLRRVVDESSNAAINVICPKPLTNANFVEWLTHSACEVNDDNVAELKKCLVADGAICQHGHCNYSWNGNLNDLANSNQLAKCISTIADLIRKHGLECSNRVVCVIEDAFLNQFTALRELVWLDSFEVKTSTSAPSVTETLDIIRNGILWRFTYLTDILENLLSCKVLNHSEIEDVCVEFKKIFVVSHVMDVKLLDVAHFLAIVHDRFRRDCDSVTMMCSDIKDIDVMNFPFEDLHSFFEFKKIYNLIIAVCQAEPELVISLTSAGDAIAKALQRLINDPLLGQRKVLKINAEFLCSVFLWEDEMYKRAPSLKDLVPVFQNYSGDGTGTISLKSALSSALNKLMTSIEKLISEACDFEDLSRKLDLLKSFIPVGDHLDISLASRHSFFYGQYLTSQSSIQEEWKDNVSRFEFAGMRDYLDNCNIPDNVAVYKRYTQLMDVIKGVLEQFLISLHKSIKDGSVMKDGFEKLGRINIEIGGDNKLYDHVKEYCSLDLKEEMTGLKKQCNEYVESLLSHANDFKRLNLDIAVRAADAAWSYNDYVRFSHHEKGIENFITELKCYLYWNGIDKHESGLACEIIELAHILCSQKSRDVSEGALSAGDLSNILDQLKVLEDYVTARPIKELLSYSSLVNLITNIFRDFFDELTANADRCGSYATALNVLKLVSIKFSESLSRHLKESEIQISNRISNLESSLAKYNESKASAFETRQGCEKLKIKLDNLKTESRFAPKKYYGYINFKFFASESREYKEGVQYYQGYVDKLRTDLVQGLDDANFDLVAKKFAALEFVAEVLYMHLKANIDAVDDLIANHLNKIMESLTAALDAKDLNIFKQRFESFYLCRKLLKDSRVVVNDDSFKKIKAVHHGLSEILKSSKDEFSSMCLEMNFTNALNNIELVKAIRQIIDFMLHASRDYFVSFEKVLYMTSAKWTHGKYERSIEDVCDDSLSDLECAAKAFPELTELSTTVQKLHTTIITTVQESVTNHEYFKLKSISEGLRSFHLLWEFGGGKDVIESTKTSVHNIIKGGLDALREDVTKHWTNKSWAELNDSIKVLQDAQDELRHFSGLIDASLMYSIHKELEAKLTDIGSSAINIANSKTGDRNERIRDFALKLAELGRVYDQVQEFHNLAKVHINRILNHCRENCGLHFIFRLGVILEEGTVFGDDADVVRIGRRFVSEFTHFKDVNTMAWNKRVSQMPVSESSKNMTCHTYDSRSKQMTPHDFDRTELESLYREYQKKYDDLVLKYLPAGTDNMEIVAQVLQQADKMKPCTLEKWDDSVKREIPTILAGIFAYYTVSKCGDSFNSIGEEEGDDSAPMNVKDILITPHNIQVLTILRLLGCADSSLSSLQNHMMQIGTGEGKSVVLGALSTIFGVLNIPVRCVCYSEYLSCRDYEDFKDIFISFKCQQHIVYSKITQFSEDSVSKKGNIRQLTQDMILGKKLNKVYLNEERKTVDTEEEKKVDEEEEVRVEDVEVGKDDEIVDKSVLPPRTINTSQREVLLVDEVDVFFGKDFYGQTYNQVTNISTPEVTALIKKIWKERGSSPTLKVISKCPEYVKLLRDFHQWKFLIDNELKLMCRQVNLFNEPPYVYNSELDQVGYSEHDAISYTLTYGYRTLFAYLHEMDKGEVKAAHVNNFEDRHLHLQVSCGQFSYANIDPACVLGVSGTLQALTEYEREVMTRYKISLYSISPSVYGTKRLVFDSSDTGIFIATTKSDYFKAIVDTINDMSCSKDAARKKYRAVIVFFESNARMQEFRKSEFFRQVVEKASVNLLSENTSKDARDYYIKKAATGGQVTLATKAFGRGTDFISRDSDLNDNGGTHIVQTYFSVMQSEEIQIQGRTSRQGQKGSYSLILLSEDDLVEPLGSHKNKQMIPRLDTLQHFDVTSQELSNLGRGERYNFLCRKRNEKRASESALIEENLSVASSRDAFTRTYFASLLSGDTLKSRALFEDIYVAFKGQAGQEQVGIHVIFMLDESGSMRGDKYIELTRAYDDFVSQRCDKDDTDSDVLTVITFDNSARTVCTMTPFSSAPLLPRLGGGGTRFYPPLVNAESALSTAEGADLLPVLVLMTDGRCDDIDKASRMMSALDDKYKEDGLQVHLVAFGQNASVSNLETLCNLCTEGHTHTAALGDLVATFKDIEQSIVVAEYHC